MVFDRGGNVSGFRWGVAGVAGGAVALSGEQADFFENAFGGDEAHVTVTGLSAGHVLIAMVQPTDRKPTPFYSNSGRGPCTVAITPAGSP
jgi:hypothetical protein